MHAKQCEAALPPTPRARTARKAAEMMSELKLQAAASVKPVRAMSCTRAEQGEVACAAQAKGVDSGRGDEKAEPAGVGERHACQGYELHARQAV